MPTIVVREGDELTLPAELVAAGMLDRLQELSDASTFPVFDFSRKKKRVAAVVGTVTCGNTRIEIRPKSAENDERHDRKFLLNLLRYCGYLKRYYTAPGQVEISDQDPVEVMIAEIAKGILQGLGDGPPRRYDMQDRETSSPRGRIDFSRLCSRPLSSYIRLPVRDAVRTSDNDLSRLLKWATQRLLVLTHSAGNKRVLLRAMKILHDVDVKGFGKCQAQQVMLQRAESQWKLVFSACQLLLTGRAFNPTISGTAHGFAVVFPLKWLFERCLRRLLSTAFAGSDLSVTHKNIPVYMLESEEGVEVSGGLRPDLVLKQQDRAVAVADAKWKLLVPGPRAFGVRPSDLQQMQSYLSHYNLQEALLLYPRTAWMIENWSKTYRVRGTRLRVHLISIDIEALVSPDPAVGAPALAHLRETIRRLILPAGTAAVAAP